MKSILITLLFITTISFAQTDVKTQYKTFHDEFETYRTNPEVASENSTIKPAPCGQYNLKFKDVKIIFRNISGCLAEC